MRAVIQRVSRASVKIEGEVVGEIARGLLVLLAVAPGDTPELADWLAEKIAHLRLFPDGDGKMKDILGGKGAGLAEMCRAGVPVPAGFTISTEVCTIYFQNGNKPRAQPIKTIGVGQAHLPPFISRKPSVKIGRIGSSISRPRLDQHWLSVN